MKYLFFDYDGTLTHGGVISEKNKEYLARGGKELDEYKNGF